MNKAPLKYLNLRYCLYCPCGYRIVPDCTVYVTFIFILDRQTDKRSSAFGFPEKTEWICGKCATCKWYFQTVFCASLPARLDNVLNRRERGWAGFDLEENFNKKLKGAFVIVNFMSDNCFAKPVSGNFTFWQKLCCLDRQKTHFLTFGNDPTVIVQYQ